MPNNVYFRILNYTLVESWIHHWQLHEIVSSCQQQPKTPDKMLGMSERILRTRERMLFCLYRKQCCAHIFITLHSVVSKPQEECSGITRNHKERKPQWSRRWNSHLFKERVKRQELFSLERRRLKFTKSWRQDVSAELLFTKSHSAIVRALGETRPQIRPSNVTNATVLDTRKVQGEWEARKGPNLQALSEQHILCHHSRQNAELDGPLVQLSWLFLMGCSLQKRFPGL